eukprot:TRINITY_DN3856_c0_g1_i1.p1 TRINITY_DN3856_c0_g1~~TRINITY_DN3856_c0_g1_i1.p1  ORF type:complete len:104 (+),score=17.93 TRINITY_DN3856_c0_g1_i1:25-336(+)
MSAPTYVVSGLLVVGGVIGASHGSKISLVASWSFAALLAYAAYTISKAPGQKTGYAIAFGASVVLALVMGRRFIASGKFMPAGLVTGLCAALAVLHASYLLQR